ncbi:MAG: SH3 domain-containing protein [Synergistaceae bacterium]|nr:SH3 domain-containing protein [Synergistaceae bacterium]
MIWIILALTLGASITSIIHGVFMLFGSLSITGAAIPGIPSTMLAILPIISAIFALIGGIIAFNRSKWGALFLFIAMGLCIPARDTWLYGGLYFFAGLFCFFLSGKKSDEYQDVYDDYGDGQEDEEAPYPYYSDGADFYYEPEEEPSPSIPLDVTAQPEGGDVLPVVNPDPPRMRRSRISKSCPECGAIVSRDAFYCPTCGAKLFVISDDPEAAAGTGPVLAHEPLEQEEDLQSVNEQLFTPEEGDNPPGETTAGYDEGGTAGSPEVPNYRVAVNQMRQEAERAMASTRQRSSTRAKDAASSYTEFSRYTNKGKKRRKSFGRKMLSMLLLVGAVGGALYFLLGLRKLPPGDLPPMNRPDPIPASDTRSVQPTPSTPSTPANDTPIAEPGEVSVGDNSLPNFTPEQTPRNGAIIGSNVNVRADHTTSSARVTRLSVGTRVEVIGMFNVPSGQYSGTWYNIRTGGREGWVYGRYLQPLGSGIPAGYSNGLLRTFGSTRTQMIEALGQPTRSTSSSVEWKGLTATVKGEDITRLRLTGKDRELQNGLKPGASQDTLRDIMGYPSSVNNRTLNYNENGKTGLSIQLDRNNAISTITVNEVQ